MPGAGFHSAGDWYNIGSPLDSLVLSDLEAEQLPGMDLDGGSREDGALQALLPKGDHSVVCPRQAVAVRS